VQFGVEGAPRRFDHALWIGRQHFAPPLAAEKDIAAFKPAGKPVGAEASNTP